MFLKFLKWRSVISRGVLGGHVHQTSFLCTREVKPRAEEEEGDEEEEDEEEEERKKTKENKDEEEETW